MNLFRKKPKITFNSLIAGVERLMPMIPAKELKHPWVFRAHKELAHLRQQEEYGMHRLVHTAKCPGIFNLQRHGWIMRTYQDITIETFGDDVNVQWTSAIDQKQLNPIANEIITLHPQEQLANYMENWDTNSIRTVIKYNSPWRCIVPKGYYLLEMPVVYQDENRFTTLHGYFSQEHGVSQMNPQLLWHIKKGKTLIKAGTPIAQYILVSKEQYDMTMTTENTITDEEFFNLVQGYKFVKDISAVKKIFRKEYNEPIQGD